VAELEVPASGSSRGDDLCPLDAHAEAPAGGRCAHRDRGLAGGRAHRRRGALRRRRGRGKRAAQGPAGSTSRPRAGPVRFHAPRSRPCSTAATRPPAGGLAAAGRPSAHGRRTHSASDRGRDKPSARGENRGCAAPAPAPPANHHAGRQRWPARCVQCFGDPRRATTSARPGPGSPRRRDQPRHEATSRDLILTSGVPEPRCIR
jgi:hypothetical protein